ncbi:DUF5667 domain-containing protein [Chloroflexota bacterium]
MNMKKFRLTLLSCVLMLSLLFSGTAYAQDEELPDPGITPDSPFYFFDTMGKDIGLFFTFGPEAKARKALEYAEERLAEAEAMAIRNKTKEMTQATNSYERFLAVANGKVTEVSRQGESANASEMMALATARHLAILDKVRDSAPEEAKEAVARVRERSMNEQQNALRALAKERIERAAEINLTTIEERLNRARVQAEKNNIAEVEDALDDAEKLYRFGEEISALAQGLSENTTVQELVAKATSTHLEVLADIYGKVPEEAKPAIEKAIANTTISRERVIEVLRSSGALGEISEEAPALERLQAEVLERVRVRVQEEIQKGAEGVQERVEEQVQEKTREQLQNLEPQLNQPSVSENESQEKEVTATEKVRVGKS